MSRSPVDISKRLLSPEPESLNGALFAGGYSPKRIKSSIEEPPPEVKSPSPECPILESSSPTSSILRSPSPMSPSQPKSSSPRLSSSKCPSRESCSVRSPSPMFATLRSPSRGPSPVKSQRGVSPSSNTPPRESPPLKSPKPSPSQLNITNHNDNTNQETDHEFDGLSSSTETLTSPKAPFGGYYSFPVAQSTLFCCSNLEKHLRTSPVMPSDLERRHGPIISNFISSVNFVNLEDRLDDVPPEELRELNRVIKVNLVEHGEEVSTHLYMQHQDELWFAEFMEAPFVLFFNPQGRGSYQSYFCRTHRRMYRVGIFDKSHSMTYNRWTYGDRKLDILMGLLGEFQASVELMEQFLGRLP